MNLRRTTILGVPIHVFSKPELKRTIHRLLAQGRQAQIVTPNPEFLLEAQRNQEFFSVLRHASLSVPDGFGLKPAAWLRGINLGRVAGSDLVPFLLQVAERTGRRVAILIRVDGLSSRPQIETALGRLYPRLQYRVEEMEPADYERRLDSIESFRPAILFVATGAPWQDIFLYRRLKEIPSVRIGMGVGGSFDFLTGSVRRAPRLFRAFGLEWVWRLLVQPGDFQSRLRRFKRIWRAVVVFPFAVIAWEFRRFKFRPNVVALIINRFGEVLILNTIGQRDYWGLPQGGVEKRESLETALRREVEEETGLSELKIIGRFEHIYSYVWPKHYTNKGYKGQEQSLFIARYYGSRGAVRINPLEHKGYRWVKLRDLVRHASPVHRPQYELFLEKYKEVESSKLHAARKS